MPPLFTLGYIEIEVIMASAPLVRVSDLPDAAQEELLKGAVVPVESDGVRVASIVPAGERASKLLGLAGAFHFAGRLGVDEIDAALDQRRR